MQKNTPAYNEMIREVASGAITRQQACEKYDVDYPTLGVWLSREGVKTGRKLAGKAAANAALLTPDKVEALDAAVARVMAGETSMYAAAKEDPNVNLSTLRLRVTQAKKSAGIAPTNNSPARPRTAEQAVEGVRRARVALAQAEAWLEEYLK